MDEHQTSDPFHRIFERRRERRSSAAENSSRAAKGLGFARESGLVRAEMRIDRFLWFARIVRSRGDGQAMARGGHVRLSGRTVDKASCCVREGDILTFATHGGRVRAIRIAALPARRGPPAEASACYEELITGN